MPRATPSLGLGRLPARRTRATVVHLLLASSFAVACHDQPVTSPGPDGGGTRPPPPVRLPTAATPSMFGGSSGLLIAVTGLAFGPVQVGTTSAAQTVAVTNLNVDPVTIAVTGGAPTAASFTLADGCDGETLAQGESCELEYTFAPATTGAVTATSSGSVNGQAFSVALGGSGFPPRFRVTPTDIHFGFVQLGSSAEQVVQVTNVGLAPVVDLDFGAATPPTPAITMTQNCDGETLDVGESCEVRFTFTPTALGTVAVQWTFGATGSFVAPTFLVGVGIAAGAPPPAPFAVSPRGLAFGDVQLGATSAEQSVNVKNIAPVPIVVFMSGGGANSPAFIATQNCHTRTLAPGESCQINYAFRPVVPGPTSPLSSASFSLNGQPFTVELAGFGAPVMLRVSPTGFDFGGVGVFTTSDPQTTSVTNAGLAPVTVAMAGGAPALAAFGAEQNCQGQTLAPGASCQIAYDFSPTTIGAAQSTSSGTLNGAAFSVGLRGEGVSPYAVNGFEGSIAAPPALNPVKAGQVVPIVFSLGGDFGLAILAAGFPVSGTIACGSSGPPLSTQPTVGPRDTPLSYDPVERRYTYAWKTDKAWKGTCRQLVLELDDGTRLVANFTFN
ncbi:MAG: hypothetical protein K0S86_3041 [Geminicoccaceae bacterium]|nr:hypothetical protein [Geminicoccaceae bacterium]